MTKRPRAAATLTRREQRFNAWLSVALLLAIVVVLNAIARSRLVVRRDLSADGLYAVSPVTERILRGLEDRLQVRTYFSRDTELGDVALARAHVETQLDEFRALAGSRMEVVELDPDRSTTARNDALRAGVRASPQHRVQGTRAIDENVWLGLVLRYRGREQVIPFAEPWRFEVQFASAVHALRRDRRVVVGLVGAPAAPPASADDGAASPFDRAWPTFGAIAGVLERGREVRHLTGLAEGRAVPKDVDVVVVVASETFHPRTVFELDRFVQRGGAAVFAVDDPVFNWLSGFARLATPEGVLEGPLGRLLRGYGAEMRDKHVWDLDWATTHGVLRGRPPRPLPVVSPAVVTVQPSGMSPVLPPTRDLAGVTLYWAHPIVDAKRSPPPAGVVREDLLWASPRARLGERLGAMPSDAQSIERISDSLRIEQSSAFVLAAAFSGALPSAFAGRDAPEARDPSRGPNATLAVAPEPLPEGASPGTVVVVGDADWLRDPGALDEQTVLLPFAAANGALFLENLIDWLTLDDELIALRSRIPRERPLTDFEQEEFEAAGLLDADPYQTDAERVARLAKIDDARERARMRRWRVMLAPIAATLAVVAALGIGWNARERRRASRAAGGGA